MTWWQALLGVIAYLIFVMLVSGFFKEASRKDRHGA